MSDGSHVRIVRNKINTINYTLNLPLKNLMMSVKSMLLSLMISRYTVTRAKARKRTKCCEEILEATQITSHTANTSSYRSSGRGDLLIKVNYDLVQW